MPQRLPNHPFRMHTAPLLTDGYLAVKLGGTESLSKPYAFDVVVLQEGPRSLTDLPQVGEHATLTLADSDLEETPPRQIHGVLSRVKLLGIAYDRDGTWVEMQLVPRLALLEHTRTKRIFQDQTAQQIVDAVLTDHDVPRRWLLDAALPVMAFEVQDDESDLAFVSRLLARFGIFYFFEQTQTQIDATDATETLVLCDRAMHYPPVARGTSTEPIALKLSDREGTFRFTESLMSFVYERQAKPTGVRHADRDMRTPGVIRDFGTTTDTEPPLHADRLVVDEFHERNANDRIRIVQADTRVELEQHRSEAAIGHGTSDCHLFAPGHRFVLDNHEYAPLNAEWVLTSIKHEGELPEFTRRAKAKGLADPPVYMNDYHCTHANLPVRPPRPQTVLRQVLETATVVGPSGEEIYVDLFGRIKVQFPWNREGQSNERSSCWVRVMQPMAGPGWGFQFIPRIGMEVAVSFIAGDTNHPVVSGCFYNALNAPTHVVPDQKSRSGIRSQSTPGGGGYNEVMFEDAAGEELVNIRAQRDLVEAVGNDARRGVGNDESRSVGHDRTDVVGRNETSTVGGQRAREVIGDDALTIGGDRFETVRGNQTIGVTEDQTIRVDGSRLDVVMGRVDTQVSGDRTVRIDEHDRREVGRLTELVDGAHMLGVNGSSAIRVGQHDAKRSYVLHVEGETFLSSTGDTEISATESITLRCGTSVIRMTPSSIEMHADTITSVGNACAVILGDEKVQMRADTAVVVKTDTITLKSSGGSLKLDDDAKLDGGTVKLKSAGSADIDSEDATTTPTTIKLADDEGNPMPGQRYILVKGDGSEIAGVLDADGQAVLVLDEAVHVMFPDFPTAETQ